MTRSFVFIAVFAGLSSFVSNSCLAKDYSDGEILFALKIKPLFAEKCNACHGNDPDEIAGQLNMLSRESLLRGGESFGNEVMVLGKGNKSYLYRVTTREEAGYEMPPKEAERLTQEQSWWIRDWINAGAPWPSAERVQAIADQYDSGVTVETSGGLDDAWTNRRYKPEDLWAYRPIQRVDVPDGVHPIDWFINRRLKEVGLQPAPAENASRLLRRLSFGLTGLPPTPDEMSKFTARAQELKLDAITMMQASRYMNSHHYGEHFARHWLDVARYSDSAGFANDYSRPNAWRYRDYVIRSFNEDKRYDQFVKEQIAGDEIDSGSPENVIATGFLRMGPWEQTGMSVFKITRQQWLDDVTDSVGQTFLAHAMQCCKCHDHKFDPLPTRDYYSMMAVFSTTQFHEPDTPFIESENKTGFAAANQWLRAKVAAYERQSNELNQKINQNKQKESGNAKVGENGLDPGDENSLARMRKNLLKHRWEHDKTRPIALAVYTGKTIQRNNVSSRLKPPKNAWGKGYIEQDAILTGGDAFSPADPVKPGALSAATELAGMEMDDFPDGQGKRRLAFANWVIDPGNPLTARVIVNRVWSWHFGKGIAGNPNNFGATGKPPTHPELLDYLAGWFVENGWSVKKLNRLIVSSAAYQRSSRHSDPKLVAERDPSGDLYATFAPRRLAAEEFRDAMLAVSGELNRQQGGIPCRPDINIEVAMQPRQIMGGTASVYEPDPLPQQRNRRTIYAEKMRGLRDPFMETFNQPGPDKSCELRETSTVAPQALTLLNAEEMQDRALAFADLLIKQQSDDNATLHDAFLRALGRPPNAKELSACLQHWQETTAQEQSKTYKPKTFASKITRTVMAEKTGEPYDFIEFMPAYEDYKPDLQPYEVDAKTRGLAQVCLVLFNSNEFAYLD